MTNLETRVRKGLGSEWTPTHSSWEGLMRLYEADREAFYLLACDGLSDGDEVTFSPLADLAHRVRTSRARHVPHRAAKMRGAGKLPSNSLRRGAPRFPFLSSPA